MKRIFSVTLATALLLTCCMGTALAYSEIEPYASPTLSYYDADMVSGGNGTAYIDFAVSSSKLADELGVEVIRFYESNGDYVKTVYGSVSNGLIYQDDMWHNDSYKVSLPSGNSYYAEVTVFATVGSETDSRTVTTSTVRIP